MLDSFLGEVVKAIFFLLVVVHVVQPGDSFKVMFHLLLRVFH